MQSEEGFWLQSFLFQGLSETSRWLQVELHEGGTRDKVSINECEANFSSVLHVCQVVQFSLHSSVKLCELQK